MKVLVTGAKGQLGTDLMNELEKRGIEGIGVDVQEMDITDAEACRRVIKNSGADAVIHCAAYTAVDAAEDNADLCRRINGEGTRNVAQACKEADVKLMYISTDYVFDGQGTRPWEPDDERHPLRSDQVRGRAGSRRVVRQILYRTNCLGIRRGRKELY